MKILIFAGGAGTRFWPLSKQGFPKQFLKMFNGKSTLQLGVDRLKNDFSLKDIYICTNNKYLDIVSEQVPELSKTNIMGEPEKRNVGPAIGLNLIRIRKTGYKGPVAILWADHLMTKPKNFVELLKKAQKLATKDKEKIFFVGEKARFANNNLGWIHFGDEEEKDVNKFIEWHYKPPLDKCKKMFASKKWYWNTGYFILDLDTALSFYEKYLPKMYEKLVEIERGIGTKEEVDITNKIYPTLEKISFDKGIAEKVPPEKALVIKVDLGWSDPGTLYALKEAQVRDLEKNLTEGNVLDIDTKDSLIINKEDGKIVTVVGLNGMIVVNTKDSLIVVHKDNVLKTTELVEKLKEKPEYEKFA